MAFIPDENNGGTSTLEVRGWDQYSDTTAPSPGSTVTISSNGGSSPYSALTSTLSIVVSDVNDAPEWPASTNGSNFTGITEDDTNNTGDLVSGLLNLQDSDNDSNPDRGVAIFRNG